MDSILTVCSGSPYDEHEGVVNEEYDEEYEEHKEVAKDFGRAHGQSARHVFSRFVSRDE